MKPVFHNNFLVVSLFIKQEGEFQVKSRCVRVWVKTELGVGYQVYFKLAFNRLGSQVQLDFLISDLKGGTGTPVVLS